MAAGRATSCSRAGTHPEAGGAAALEELRRRAEIVACWPRTPRASRRSRPFWSTSASACHPLKG